jgi:PilZ domain-containing protein
MDPATPPTDLRQVLFDGRIEKRVTMTVPVHLATANGHRVAERTFTRNVSPHGARVVTNRLWKPGEEPLLTPLTGEFPQPARVVYCVPRARGGFYLGLQFTARSVKWDESPRS